ncbi:RimK family alpha-L-glutamate ligase [Streptomyces sp. NRRL B-1347]|uniref:RimK family alpha-L-glutamate ligase n=1 Tax=Streptomyces sp. NRRL B-1347 TaxID=1476877 RepID=UPI000AE83EFC|nr:RimK family alpha-L-glutamate ligase [Streptomyces sp. NRRL B-1347]
MEPQDRTRPVIAAPAHVWMLVRQQPTALRRSTRELADALTEAHGDRFAVWHTDELLFGVQGGRLVLRTLGGAELPAPEVVCVRQVAGPMRDDREVTLLRHLERMGSTLVNGVDAHLNSRNKIWQLQELALAGLPVPDTLSYATAPLEGVVRSPSVEAPCVVKSVSGCKGTQVFLAPDGRMLRAVAGSLQQDVPFLFQEHVAHSHGRTLRVIVVDGEPVDAVLHTSDNGGLTANIAKGGSAALCRGRYPRAEELAVAAARALGLDIAGVDLLFASADTYTICEVNAVPGWRPAMKAVVPAVTACVNRRLADRRGGSGGNSMDGPVRALR